jgi:uncharacterized membrane protein required for colicin V production
MNWLDYTFIAILCLSAALGFWSGLMWQAYGIFCLVVSYFSAIALARIIPLPFANRLSPGTASILEHVIFFVAVLVASVSLGLLIRKVLHLYPNLMGRFLGMVLGLLQGLVLCGVLAVGLVEYSSGNLRQTAEASEVVSTFASIAQFLSVVIPGDIKRNFEDVKKRTEDIVEGVKDREKQ